MKFRTALFLAGLMLITGAVIADDTIGNPNRELNPFDRASRIMQVPYYLDGVLFPARHPLPEHGVSIIVGRGDGSNRAVHVFTSRLVVTEFLRQEKAARDASKITAEFDCTWTEDYSWFNKNVGCGGAGPLTLYYPNSYDDLDFGGWNNTMSCVKAACNGYYTVIYACRNFATTEGFDCDDADYLYIFPGDIITDLNAYGMNNRASSVQFVP